MEFAHWDTSTAAPKDQFDLYRSGLCASFAHLTPKQDGDATGFSADINTWSDDTHSLTQMTSQSHRVERSRNDLKKVEDDHLYLNIVMRGEMHLRQGSAQARLRPGDMFVVDNARSFEARLVETRGYMHFALRLPRSHLSSDVLRDREHLTAHPASGLLRASFAMLADAPDGLRMQMVEPALRSMTAVLDHMATHPTEPETLRRALNTRRAIEHSIAAHFADPEFAFPQAVRMVGIADRTVQFHLSRTGVSFSRLLLDFRLQRAVDLIASSTDGSGRKIGIEEVAYRTGFSDLSTFYRAFKRKYGTAPGQYRP